LHRIEDDLPPNPGIEDDDPTGEFEALDAEVFTNTDNLDHEYRVRVVIESEPPIRSRTPREVRGRPSGGGRDPYNTAQEWPDGDTDEQA